MTCLYKGGQIFSEIVGLTPEHTLERKVSQNNLELFSPPNTRWNKKSKYLKLF
jgi:hypothetical protein